jgi:hypothetical protein
MGYIYVDIQYHLGVIKHNHTILVYLLPFYLVLVRDRPSLLFVIGLARNKGTLV